MIHRIQRGLVPEKPHTAFYMDGQLVYEHCLTRKGFDEAYTILYHRNPPHWVRNEEFMGQHPGYAEPFWEGSLRRRHFRSTQQPEGGTPFFSRRLLLGNHDIGIWNAQPNTSDTHFVVNADGDELVFIREGSGYLISPMGQLAFQPEDYVFIPRGLPHRWQLDGKAHFLYLEGKSELDVPTQFRNPSGQLRMDAPYSHRDFREPVWPLEGMASEEYRVIVKKGEQLTALDMTYPLLDTLGWDGQVWPFAFPIRSFQPKTGQVHLPPTIHTTFAGGGFVVCSFVPRMVDFHEKAIPCPYPHSSVSCDEFLFYVDGNFTSRKGIGTGSISLHPSGLPHGPHPGSYEASIGTRETNELAVMVDTFAPLYPTAHAIMLEDPNYNQSWSES